MGSTMTLPPPVSLKLEQYKHRLQEERLDGEEVARQELGLLPAEEGAPGAGLPPAYGGGRHAVPPEHVADRGAPARVAELAQFALEAAVAPPRVLPRQLQEQLLDLVGEGRATAGLVTPAGPLATDQLAVPLQDGLRLEQQDAVVQSRPRAGGHVQQLAGQGREGELLPAGEAGRRALALEQAHLVRQQEDLQVLVAVGPTPDADEVDEERHEMHEHEPAHEVPPPLSITSRRPRPPLLRRS